jgi:hypothetical protein
VKDAPHSHGAQSRSHPCTSSHQGRRCSCTSTRRNTCAREMGGGTRGGRRYNREEGGSTTPVCCSPLCLPSPPSFWRSLLEHADSSSMNCSLPRTDLSSRYSSSSSTLRSRGSSRTDDPVLSLHLVRAALLCVALPPDVLPLGDKG